LLASVALHFGYYIALASAYRYGDFSQAYPVARGTAPILVTLWGVFVLRESLSAVELAAVIGVIAGIMIFATRRLGVVLHDRRALVSALVTSFFIGGYTIVDGVGGRLSQNVPAYMVWLAILDGSPMVLYAVQQRSLARVIALKSAWRISLFGSVLSLTAYWMVVWAMTKAPIPLVSALRETSIIIAALIGAYYFREPAGRRRVIASVVIFASIVLLGWSDS
ncbi:MAG: EamA family transporter, partial [Hyphomicrobiales bacterium]